MCVPEVAEELPPTDVGEEHVEAVGVLEAPGQRHNEGVAHLPANITSRFLHFELS